MNECDIRYNTCRTHKGISNEQISIPNVGSYCDDYVDAMHEELHYALLFDYDLRYSKEEYLKSVCKFCEVDE